MDLRFTALTPICSNGLSSSNLVEGFYGRDVLSTTQSSAVATARLHITSRCTYPFLWSADHNNCEYCKAGLENLCNEPQFTGYTRDGGYAELTTADERFCVPIPEAYTNAEAAPLMCAGLIGFRSLAKTGNARRVGVYGLAPPLT